MDTFKKNIDFVIKIKWALFKVNKKRNTEFTDSTVTIKMIHLFCINDNILKTHRNKEINLCTLQSTSLGKPLI